MKDINTYSPLVLPYYLSNCTNDAGINFINSSTLEEFTSYKELREMALLFLKNLQDLKLSEGDEVVFQIQDRKLFLIVFWACIIGKFIPIPLSVSNANSRDQRLKSIWDILRNPYLITDVDREFLDLMNTLEDRIINVNQLNINNGFGELKDIKPDDIAYVQFSSGSSGNPKGVSLTHRNLCFNALDIASRSQITVKDSSLCWMPLTHDMGMIGFHITSLISEINQHIIPTEVFIRRPDLWILKASEHKASILYSPNFGLKYFLSALTEEKAKDWNLSEVRIIYNGAEPILHSLCETFVQKLGDYGLRKNSILTVYGLAEASVAVTIPDVGKSITSFNIDRSCLNEGEKVKFLSSATDLNAVNFVSVGYAITHCEVRIKFKNSVLVEDYLGEIQIKGENVTAGYYNDDIETSGLFTKDKWLKTGDIGFLHNGELVIVGRSKNVIIVNGQNYYPHDLESAVYSIEGVELGKVAFCGVWDSVTQQDKIIGFVLFKKNLELFVPIIRLIKEELFKRTGLIVDDVVPVKKIPKTTSGKVQYFKLKKDYQEGVFNDVIVVLNNLLQNDVPKDVNVKEQLSNLIKSIIDIPEVNFENNIFNLGLSSLQALEFCSRVNATLKINISMTDLFRYKTLNELLKEISEHHLKVFNKIERVEDYNNLLPIQRRFWFLHQLDESNSMLNITTSIQISGNVDRFFFKQAFQAVVERHESLRYNLKMEEGTLYLALDDFRSSPEILFIDEADDAENIKAILGSKFDIARGPLYRAILHKTGSNKYEFIFQIHHVIADGWSVKVVLCDLIKFYNGISKGKLLHEIMPPLIFHFLDYVSWVENSLKKEFIHKQYWENEFKLIQEATELPFIKKTSISTELRSNFEQIQLDNDFYNDLKLFAENHNTTVYIVLVACLNVLLYKYSGQSTNVISILSSGRGSMQLSDQVGCYIKLLPLIINVDSSENFITILDQAKSKVINAVDHELYSYDRLIEEQARNNGNVIKLSDITVVMQDFDSILDFQTYKGDLKITGAEQINEGTASKMQFDFVLKNSEFFIKINFNEELFNRSDMQGVLHNFETLLASVLKKSDFPIASLDYLDKKEENKLLTFSRPVPFIERKESVIELFDDQVKKTPNKIALVCNNVNLTYQELQKKTIRVSNYLNNEWRIKQGDVVSLVMDRSENLIISMLGVLRSKATYLAIDISYPIERVTNMIHQSESNSLLFDTYSSFDVNELFPDKKTAVLDDIICDNEKLDTAMTQLQNEHPSLNDSAYIIFSSGTTGLPKGMSIDHGALVDYVITFSQYFNISDQDIVIHQASITFDTIIEEIFPILIAGGKLIVSKQGGKYLDDLVEMMELENVSILSTTPIVINELNKRDKIPGLRLLISGGDELKPFQVDRLLPKIDIYNTYGPSESTVCATYNKLTKADDTHIIGAPITNRILLLLNNDMQLVPVGCLGNIYIGGVGLTKGYLDTREDVAFKYSSYFNGQKIYKSGDLGMWMPDGRISFYGRKDNQIKINGYRVETEDVENNLRKLVGIDDVVVIGKQNLNGGKSLIAFYVSEVEFKNKELVSSLNSKIPFYMIPSHFVKLDEMPITINGKMDRKALEVISTSLSKSELQEPCSKIEEKLLVLWKKEFGFNEIGVHSNFFALGGHSLMAVNLINQINKVFNVQVSIKEFFEQANIHALSNSIETNAGTKYADIKQATYKDSYDLSPSQNGLWLLNEFEGNTIGYNIFGAFELVGKLNIKSVQKTFKTIIGRHESLRTNFVKTDNYPQQIINSTDDFLFEIEVFNLENNFESDKNIVVHLENLRSYKFNLEKSPLIKVALLLVADETAILTVTLHHLVADGISASILIDEFLSIYKAISNGEDIIMIPSPIQFKDYSEWLSKLVDTDKMTSMRVFWCSKLKEPRQVLNLPLDYPRTEFKSYEGNQVEWMIDSERTTKLGELFNKYNATYYSGFLSVIKILLFKYSGNEDIIVGGPSIGRHHPDLTTLIGCFVNTLVVRSHIKGSYSFGQVLSEIKKNVAESYDNSEYPFESMLLDLDVARDYKRSPLFDVRFIYDDGELKTRSFEKLVPITEELKIKKIAIPVSRSIYDITFSFARMDDVRVIIEYNNQLFDKETIELLSIRLNKIIDEILNNELIIVDELNWQTTFKDQSFSEKRNHEKESF